MALGKQRTGSVNDRLLRYAQDTHAVLNRAGGQIFYVDKTAGDDSNPGTIYAAPFLTVTYALSQCTAGAGDIIQIIQNSPSTPPGGETFPINVNVANVTIRGSLSYPGALLSDSGIGADDDNPCITIGAHYVTLEDMYFGIRPSGHAGGVIELTDVYFGVVIRRCTIETQYTAGYGIDIQIDCPYLLIEDCVLGRIGGRTGAYDNFTDAIRIANLTGGVIRRNLISGYTGIGISAPGTGTPYLMENCYILDNRFSLPSDDEGKAITLGDGCSRNFIDGNVANYGRTVMGTNPYKDTGDASNTWGLNYKGITATMPVAT